VRRAGVAAVLCAAAGLTVWVSFNTCARLITAGFRGWERFVAWQGASPDQRARMRREKRSRVKAFDWVQDTVGREQ
jgi:short subunit dehydrogenase-like uncharacterized protein